MKENIESRDVNRKRERERENGKGKGRKKKVGRRAGKKRRPNELAREKERSRLINDRIETTDKDGCAKRGGNSPPATRAPSALENFDARIIYAWKSI